jgi:hypothetical protein
MRKTVALPFAGLALASLLAAGCSGSGAYGTTASTATPTPFPIPSATCTPPAGFSVQQVFPQNNSTTAANLQGVVFAVAPGPLPTNWYIYAKSAAGTTAGTASIGFLATPVPVPGSTAGSTPTPLPTPSDAPTFAPTSFIYETTSIGTFANNTAFTIFLANTNCFPGLQESTFTTTLHDSPSPTPSPSPTST